jgi:hypothetical protein
MRRSSNHSSNHGLATAAVGLLILIAGLRSAVAEGDPCTGHGSGAVFRCGGSCPDGDACAEASFPDWTGRGRIVQCNCRKKDGRLYSAIDFPTCALAHWEIDSCTFYICVAQGCRKGCAFDDATCDVDGTWSCACGE